MCPKVLRFLTYLLFLFLPAVWILGLTEDTNNMKHKHYQTGRIVLKKSSQKLWLTIQLWVSLWNNKNKQTQLSIWWYMTINLIMIRNTDTIIKEYASERLEWVSKVLEHCPACFQPSLPYSQLITWISQSEDVSAGMVRRKSRTVVLKHQDWPRLLNFIIKSPPILLSPNKTEQFKTKMNFRVVVQSHVWLYRFFFLLDSEELEL